MRTGEAGEWFAIVTCDNGESSVCDHIHKSREAAERCKRKIESKPRFYGRKVYEVTVDEGCNIPEDLF